jgi:hypothetical protein
LERVIVPSVVAGRVKSGAIDPIFRAMGSYFLVNLYLGKKVYCYAGIYLQFYEDILSFVG